MGVTRYYPSYSCAHGHSGCGWLVSNHTCGRCLNIKRSKRRKASPEARSLRNRKMHERRVATPQKRAKFNKQNARIRNPIARPLRTRIRQVLEGKVRTGSAVRDLGCTISEFRDYIEAKFQLSMAWDNRGTVWELDHIQPLSNFDLTDREQFLAACHFTNYQPLTIADHRVKTTQERTQRRPAFGGPSAYSDTPSLGNTRPGRSDLPL